MTDNITAVRMLCVHPMTVPVGHQRNESSLSKAALNLVGHEIIELFDVPGMPDTDPGFCVDNDRRWIGVQVECFQRDACTVIGKREIVFCSPGEEEEA